MEKYKKEYQWFSSVLFWMLSAMAVGVLIVIVIILNNVNSNAETDNSKHMVALIAKSTESAFWKSVFSKIDNTNIKCPFFDNYVFYTNAYSYCFSTVLYDSW